MAKNDKKTIRKKLNYKHKSCKQKGGNGNNANKVTEPIFNFVNEIEKYKAVGLYEKGNTNNQEILKKLANPQFNIYYNDLLNILPCSMNIRDTNSVLIKYEFDSTFNLVKDSQIYDKFNDETYFGSSNSIYCEKINDDSYIVIMGLDINIICDEQLQLINYFEKKFESGHALTLILKNKPIHSKSFSIIDSNGNETHDKNIVKKLLTHILDRYGYSYLEIEFPACQIDTYIHKGSCLLWSQLYIELILRFGIDTAKQYLTTLTGKALGPDDFILKYASYVNSCIVDSTKIIKEYNYVLAEQLRMLLFAVNIHIQSMDFYKNRGTKYDVATHTDYKHYYIIFCYNYSNFIFIFPGLSGLYYRNTNINPNNRYVAKSDDINITKLLSIFIKNFNSAYTKLKLELEKMSKMDVSELKPKILFQEKKYYVINEFYETH
jgi:hypothetical protein